MGTILIAFMVSDVVADNVAEASVIVPPVPKTEDPLVDTPL